MAPGVGKTYRMLQEGVAEADSGRDVAIGYLEPHGRAETLAQAEGLEIIPRRHVVYRGTPLEEMDLPAVLARKPELCLIDELAHTNAPGLEHEKRYEDVRDVIEAGIDVYSTVNVQHLESLNDQVTQLTGARVRETIPDEVLSAADEVVLIDLTPEALIARLRAGKVYRPERVPAALNNFFKIENLSALRETALRQVAEDVEVKRLVREPSPVVRRDEEGFAGAPRRVRRRSPSGCSRWPRSRRTPSGSCGAPGARPSAWTPSSTCSSCARPAVRPAARTASAWRRCGAWSSMLGARLHVEEGEDVAAVAIELARELGTTYVLMGTPAPPRGLGRLSRSIPGQSLLARLLAGLPGVDVRLVADPSLRRANGGPEESASLAGFQGHGDEQSDEALNFGARSNLWPRRLFQTCMTPRLRGMSMTRRLRRPPRLLTLAILLALLSGLLVSSSAIGQAGTSARRSPSAHAAASYLTGIGDEHAKMFSNPLWQQLHTKIARYIAPYDAAARSFSLDQAKLWIHAAEAQHQQVLVAFYHSEYTPTKLPSVGLYQHDVQKFIKLFPHVRQYQSWDESNRGNVPHSFASPSAAASAKYYQALIRVCKGCTAIGLDVLDQANIAPTLRYISEFKR